MVGICLGAEGRLAARKPKDPWGELYAKPLIISPPAEYIPRDDGPAEHAIWRVASESSGDLADDLKGFGFGPDDVASLVTKATPRKDRKGFVLEPGSAFVRKVAPDVRAKLYRELAKDPANFDQASAYYFHGDSLDQWLGADAVSPKVRALVEPLVYRIGEFLYVADIEIVREEMGSGPEFQNLVRRLLRQQAMFVSLAIDDPDDLDAVTEYWGRGGRKTDIQPLLESIADAGPSQTINVSELLPELPRRLLYRYPRVTLADLAKPQLENCFWTALNFFNTEPDDRYLDAEYAMNHLRQDYFLVHDRHQLGDIVVFSDKDMHVFHVAVYLANDLVFTKNGAFSLAPWTILPIDQLKGPYVGHADDWHIGFYRRKDM